MARKSRPVEKLEITYRKNSPDIEEVYTAMFGAAAPAAEQKPGALPSPAPAPFDRVSSIKSATSKNNGAPELNAPALTAPDISAPDYGAPYLSAPTLEVPIARAANLGAPHVSAPTLDAPDLYALDLDTINVGAPEFQYRLPVRAPLVEAKTVQDGHTHGEQAVFSTLWRLARPIRPTIATRILSIGERTLAAEVPMSYSSVQAHVRSLVTKLAIKIRPRGNNQPKAYVVHSYEEILRRRRAAGLTHIQRRTNSVTLVNPGAPHLGAPTLDASAPNLLAPKLEIGAPKLTNSGAPTFGAHLRKNQERNTLSSSSIGNATIAAALMQVIGHEDDDAVARITTACREICTDASDEEIVEFIQQHGTRFVKIKSIENPMGMLIWQIPKSFLSDVQRTRKAEQERRELEAARNEELRKQWQRIIDDPGAPEEDKKWARKFLDMEEPST
jgi:hypothetical protein